MLDAEDIQGKRRRADRYDAVFADDAVLFATAHQFAGKEQKRAFAAVDQDKLVHRSAGRLGNQNWPAVTATDHFFGATLPDEDFPGGQTLFQSQKSFFFFNDTAAPEIYTSVLARSRLDALPSSPPPPTR